jgi:hypothetical protein
MTVTKMIRNALYVLIGTGILLDAALWHLDPLGVRHAMVDWHQLSRGALPAVSGYHYTPGPYDMLVYDATIGLDGLRVVPDTRYSDCTVATIGDSITFGMGVQDNQTFTNLLAQTFTDVQWVNAGMPAYNVENVREQLAAVPADGYIWLIIRNDDVPRARYGYVPPVLSATALYLEFFFYPDLPAPDFEFFDTTAREMLSRRDVLPFVHEHERLIPEILAHYPAIPVVPNDRQQVVSAGDNHPNAAGHQQIAHAMQPYVAPFIERICHG